MSRKKEQQFLLYNFNKLKHIFTIFCLFSVLFLFILQQSLISTESVCFTRLSGINN